MISSAIVCVRGRRSTRAEMKAISPIAEILSSVNKASCSSSSPARREPTKGGENEAGAENVEDDGGEGFFVDGRPPPQRKPKPGNDKNGQDVLREDGKDILHHVCSKRLSVYYESSSAQSK
jgi:hypothetical protein